MDIKSQSQLLKKRAKELGYDIKLTHAQEMIASIYGHQSRHSALLQDSKSNKTVESFSLSEFYLDPQGISTNKDYNELAQKGFDIGLKLGQKYGKPLSNNLNALCKESEVILNSDRRKTYIFKQSLYYGALKYLQSTLNIEPLREFFKEIESSKSKFSPLSGLGELQRILKKRTQDMWKKVKNQSHI